MGRGTKFFSYFLRNGITIFESFFQVANKGVSGVMSNFSVRTGRKEIKKLVIIVRFVDNDRVIAFVGFHNKHFGLLEVFNGGEGLGS